jgi:hypothetical protein
MSHRPRRRSLVARLLHSIWRGLRIVLLAFAAIGPRPPPPPPTGPDPTEQVQEARPRARVQRRGLSNK